jgi:hypothetical protein
LDPVRRLRRALDRWPTHRGSCLSLLSTGRQTALDGCVVSAPEVNSVPLRRSRRRRVLGAKHNARSLSRSRQDRLPLAMGQRLPRQAPHARSRIATIPPHGPLLRIHLDVILDSNATEGVTSSGSCTAFLPMLASVHRAGVSDDASRCETRFVVLSTPSMEGISVDRPAPQYPRLRPHSRSTDESLTGTSVAFPRAYVRASAWLHYSRHSRHHYTRCCVA